MQEPVVPERKLRLLEARMGATPQKRVVLLEPGGAAAASARAGVLARVGATMVSMEDDVGSFSSDGSVGANGGLGRSRRNYAPRPGTPGGDGKKGNGALLAPEKGTRKRRRVAEAVGRKERVDAYFRPVGQGGGNATGLDGSSLKDTAMKQARRGGGSREKDSTDRVSSVEGGDENSSHVRRELTFVSPALQDDCDVVVLSTPGEDLPNHVMGQEAHDVNLPGQPDAYRHFRARLDALEEENSRLRSCEGELAEAKATLATLEAENEDLRTRIELELDDVRQQLDEKITAVEKADVRADAMERALKTMVTELARCRRAESQRMAGAVAERLGRVTVERSRTSLHEVWEEGTEWKSIDSKLKAIQLDRVALDKKRKDIARIKILHLKNEAAAVATAADVATTEDSEQDNNRLEQSTVTRDSTMDMPPPPAVVRPPSVAYEESAAYAAEQEEIYRVQAIVLKREETALLEQRAKLTRERDLLIRELRRQSDEKLSSFNTFPVVNNRYVVLNLLGRGGFSEVFKAFDLRNATYVACKIHQLASNWSEEKKRTFIRHAMREYEIHKSLKHPRVVQLVDIFEIDENTFCTVLEYCDGSDLDSHLRANQLLPEREARSVISQVFSGLLHLSEQKKRIIHYDLKPGNILFNKGEVRITDFGLSKIMSENETTADGMELTSQGAGTMWYLPPECFETASQARISSKVDVWSAGVILFQMLYGRKPFGHDQSQEKMFRDKTVNHQELEFPAKPPVSEAAKDFMRRCLTRQPAQRPDVRQIMLHSFLRRR